MTLFSSISPGDSVPVHADVGRCAVPADELALLFLCQSGDTACLSSSDLHWIEQGGLCV